MVCVGLLGSSNTGKAVRAGRPVHAGCTGAGNPPPAEIIGPKLTTAKTKTLPAIFIPTLLLDQTPRDALHVLFRKLSITATIIYTFLLIITPGTLPRHRTL